MHIQKGFGNKILSDIPVFRKHFNIHMSQEIDKEDIFSTIDNFLIGLFYPKQI